MHAIPLSGMTQVVKLHVYKQTHQYGLMPNWHNPALHECNIFNMLFGYDDKFKPLEHVYRQIGFVKYSTQYSNS